MRCLALAVLIALVGSSCSKSDDLNDRIARLCQLHADNAELIMTGRQGGRTQNEMKAALSIAFESAGAEQNPLGEMLIPWADKLVLAAYKIPEVPLYYPPQKTQQVIADFRDAALEGCHNGIKKALKKAG